MTSRKPARRAAIGRVARRVLAGVIAPVLAAALVGCGRPASNVELVSYKDPYFPESYRVAFPECAYRIERGGDYEIVAKASRGPGHPSDGTIAQFLSVHVFWKPWPGKTFSNSTAMDATIRYVLTTSRGVATYTGTGFVYPRRRRDGQLVTKIEAARLRLESQGGDPPDVLGRSRLTGTLVAVDHPSRALDLLREMELSSARHERQSGP